MVNKNRYITPSGIGNKKTKKTKITINRKSKKQRSVKNNKTENIKTKNTKNKNTKNKNTKQRSTDETSKSSKKNIVIQNGGFNKEKTVCAPYMVQKKGLVGKGINNGQSVNANGKMILAEKGKKVEVIPTVHPDSCMGHNELITIINAWNASYGNDDKTKINKQGDKGLVKSDDKLWEELRDKIDTHITQLTDEGEHEWWEQDFVKDKLGLGKLLAIQDSIYAPEAPESWKDNPITWLNTLDIEDVLNQYEKMYPEFKSYGASPIDFDLVGSDGSCQVNPLCNISMKKLIKGEGCGGNKKQYVGVVFNLDKHYESGSHWIAMFVNIPKAEINYWDSYGYQPPQEVKDLMKKIKLQLEALGINAKIQINNIRHQFQNSECGVYSLHFIIKQLKGDSYQKVCKNKISDDEMNDYRQMFFTNAK